MSKDHEYSSIEKLETGAISALNEIPNISKVARGAQKSFISFLAEWCPNCDFEAVQLREYYKNYETEFDFYLVMLFSSNELNNIFIKKYDLQMKSIKGELNAKDEKLNLNSKFYNFRNIINDDRKWGVPMHIIKIGYNNFFTIKGESIKTEVVTLLEEGYGED
tara:strand:+ start:12 stop:500 length:489 start_codon:yes stop_codon:yes gene_type:complete